MSKTVVSLLAAMLLGGSMPLVGATTDTDREAAIRELEERFGEVSPAAMLWSLNPRQPEALRLFLAVGLPADGLIEVQDGELILHLSPLQYTLWFACEDDEKALEVVRILLDAGADPNRPFPRSGTTALIEAARQSCDEIVELLLERGADPNVKAEHDVTALRHAVLFGTERSVRRLVEGGADVAGDRDRLLELARSSPEKLAILQRAGAGSPAIRTAPAPRAPRSLEEALRQRDVDGARAFLAADATALSRLDAPALIYLVERCREEDPGPLVALVGLLLEHGAAVDDLDSTMQETALEHAAGQCPVEVVQALLTAGAAPDHQDAVGKTPLFQAVFADRPEAVEALLRAGAKPDRNTKFFAQNKPEIKALLQRQW